MSRDLTCNETLGVDDSERNKESIVRRFPPSQSTNPSAFRANYNTSVSSVKCTIQKPVPKSPFFTTSPASHMASNPGTSTSAASDESLHLQLPTASHSQLQNSNASRHYKSVSNNSDFPTSAGIPHSQLQIFAGSALLRNAVAAAGYRDDRPMSTGAAHTLNYASQLHTNAMNANIYTTINNMRFQQQQQQQQALSNSEKSQGAVTLAAVQAATAARTTIDNMRQGVYHPQVIYKNIASQPAQHPTLLPRPTMASSSQISNRYSAQNGTKQSSSPNLIRPNSATHYVIPHQPVASPCRLVTGHNVGHGSYHLQVPPATNISGSPGLPQPLQQIISTSSPRPSILRKRGDGSSVASAAKRRLPFLEETPSLPSNVTQATAPLYSVVTTPPTFQLSKETVNGTTEESPRKRMRKQQFEPDIIPEQIKMAIDVVQPIAGGSGPWRFAGQSGFITPGMSEKKKRGRPRANSRPATALPIELHQSVSVFVDIDSPEEKLKPAVVPESSTISRGSTASVPPVHIDVSKSDLKQEVEETHVSGYSGLQQVSNGENTQRKQGAKRKDKAGISIPSKASDSSWMPCFSDEVNNDLLRKGVMAVEEQQHEDVTGFLADCLRVKRKEQRVREEIRELDPTPSGSNMSFDMGPQSADEPNTSTYSPLPTVQKWPKKAISLANHFKTVKEFNTIYDQYRKLKILQRRNASHNSSINIREMAERYVQNCENDVDNIFNLPGFKPEKPLDMSEKSKLVAYVEQIIKERLKKAGINSSNSIIQDRHHANDDYRLPVVSCEGLYIEEATSVTTTSDSKKMLLDTCTVLKEVEQLVDEMVSFVTRDQSLSAVVECAKRTFARNIAVPTMMLETDSKVKEGQASKQSRSGMQGDSFTTILNDLKLPSDESREIFDNVFTVGPAYSGQSWWNIVASKKNRRIRGRLNFSKPSLPEFPKSVSSCCDSNVQVPNTLDDVSCELNLTSLKEELAVRLQHMDRQLSEQIRFEEKLLEIFERFYGVYNPKDYFKMKLDMERDLDDGDSPATIYQKRIQRLRFVLSLPPCKLPPDRKPDFGEQCVSVISCPDQVEMNRHMLGISPFWKGPLIKNNTKNFYITRTGRRMHDKDESYVPLEDDYKELYLEDLVDYREPAVFRRDYANMERIWAKLENLKLTPPESDAKKHVHKGDWISRRTLARCKDSEVVCLGSLQTDAFDVIKEGDNTLYGKEADEFLRFGESTQEILATAFKAIRQTTLMMIQTRNAMLELAHLAVENDDDEDDEDDQDESVDDEEDFNRQMEQAMQESCQEHQSTSKL